MVFLNHLSVEDPDDVWSEEPAAEDTTPLFSELQRPLQITGTRPETIFISRSTNLTFSLVLLIGCYSAILIPAYLPVQKTDVQYTKHPKDLALLNLSAAVLSSPCKPQWCLTRLQPLSCSAGLLNIPVFVQQEDLLWEQPPPLGLQGSEVHLALALASLPQHALPSAMSVEGHCRRCVVVGNGGILHGSHLGSHIDQYDIIISSCKVAQDFTVTGSFLSRRSSFAIREKLIHNHITKDSKLTEMIHVFVNRVMLNNAPVPGYQRDAGSRTTIRLVYPEGAPRSAEEYKNTSTVALVVFKSLDLEWLTSVITKQPLSFWSKMWFWREVVEEIPLRPENFRILHPEIIHKTGQALQKYAAKQGNMVPTLGASAVVMALQLCDHVSLAGFGYDMQHPEARLHYYEEIRMDAMNAQVVHDVSAEKLFLRDLVAAGAVTDLTGAL